MKEIGMSFFKQLRGVGFANEGTSHYWFQRVTAVALIPLGLWFVIANALMVGSDYVVYREWIGSVSNGVLMIFFLIFLFYHIKLGLESVIEDYVHAVNSKIVLLVANKIVNAFFLFAGILFILILMIKG